MRKHLKRYLNHYKVSNLIYISFLTLMVLPYQSCDSSHNIKSAAQLSSSGFMGNGDNNSDGGSGGNGGGGTYNGGSYTKTCTTGPAVLEYVRDIKPIVEKNCKTCHMNGSNLGGFSIPNFTSDESARQDSNTWNRVLHAVNGGGMPLGISMPAAEKTKIATWFQTTPTGVSDPGFVPMQRLTGKQWDNSVSDLLGTSVSQSHQFPADAIGKGQFTNNAATIANINIELFGKLRAATDAAVDGAFANNSVKQNLLSCGTGTVGSGVGVVKIPVSHSMATLTYSGSTTVLPGAEQMTSNGRLTFTIPASYFPQAATEIAVYAGGGVVEGDWGRFNLFVNGTQVATNFAPESNVWQRWAFTAQLRANQINRVDIDYINDVGNRDLWVQAIEFQGASGSSAPSTTLTKSCAENIILDFARRAFRRPISTVKDPNDVNAYVESDALKKFVSAAASVPELEDGVKLAMKAVLLSPKFLYRAVILNNPNDKNMVESLDPYELAAQLSYFIWNTIPDEELYNAAKNGGLSSEAGIRVQVQRMLASTRSKSFTDELADGWLTLKDLQSVSPSDAAFTSSTRAAMQGETQKFLSYIVQQNRSPLEILTADYSFVNNELAGLYGMSSPGTSTHTKMTLPANRRGILGHGALLTLTTKAARTSPIHRGVWALKSIMCEELGAPPAGVQPLEEVVSGTTIKEQLAAHRNNVQCASCHNRIDPIGLSFENFDPIGRFRTKYKDGSAVDSGGVLPDGSSFTGTTQFIDVLLSNKKFNLCVSKKVLSYAIARDVAAEDNCAVEKIGLEAVESNKSFVDFVTTLTSSDPFKKRRGSGE